MGLNLVDISNIYKEFCILFTTMCWYFSSSKGSLGQGRIYVVKPPPVPLTPWKWAANKAPLVTDALQSTWWRCTVRNISPRHSGCFKPRRKEPDYLAPHHPYYPCAWVKGPFFCMPADCRRKERGAREGVGSTLGMNEVIKGKVCVNIGFVAKSGQ